MTKKGKKFEIIFKQVLIHPFCHLKRLAFSQSFKMAERGGDGVRFAHFRIQIIKKRILFLVKFKLNCTRLAGELQVAFFAKLTSFVKLKNGFLSNLGSHPNLLFTIKKSSRWEPFFMAERGGFEPPI
ncbi:MAG: hypothetical protein EBT63_05485 [Proteobacteria bacterium]|nr:hypothetical protein [Pseudomonadota bacterium]